MSGTTSERTKVAGGRRRVRRAVAAAALLGAAALAGCATLGRAVFQEPVVDFRSLRINGLGLTGGSLDLQLAVYNPNSFDMEATRFSYNLLMDSTRIADGLLDTRQTFRSGDSTVVTIPINFSYAGLGRAGRELLQRGTINYRVAGDVTVDTPLGSFTRPYTSTGTYTPIRGASSGRQ
jgi:LEA14-like dessication related protein